MPQFIPDIFRQAQPADILAVHRPGARPLGFDSRQQPQTMEGLVRKRACASSLGTLAAGPEVELASGSWQELVEDTGQWIEGRIEACDLSEYAALCESHYPSDLSSEEVRSKVVEHVKKAAREGTATIGAYLEVVGKVSADRELEDPGREVAATAVNGFGFATEWAGLDVSVDSGLAYSLATPKPRDIMKVFENLHFDRYWFAEQKGRVVIDPSKAHDLLDYTGHLPNHVDSGKEILFGCPGRHWLPRIYRRMVQGAAAGQLFGQTYEAARQGPNIGEDRIAA